MATNALNVIDGSILMHGRSKLCHILTTQYLFLYVNCKPINIMTVHGSLDAGTENEIPEIFLEPGSPGIPRVTTSRRHWNPPGSVFGNGTGIGFFFLSSWNGWNSRVYSRPINDIGAWFKKKKLLKSFFWSNRLELFIRLIPICFTCEIEKEKKWWLIPRLVEIYSNDRAVNHNCKNYIGLQWQGPRRTFNGDIL